MSLLRCELKRPRVEEGSRPARAPEFCAPNFGFSPLRMRSQRLGARAASMTTKLDCWRRHTKTGSQRGGREQVSSREFRAGDVASVFGLKKERKIRKRTVARGP